MGGGITIQTIVANRCGYAFSNLYLPIDKAISDWGKPMLSFFNFIGSLYDTITITFSILVYVLLGRKYFTYLIKCFIFINILSFFIFISVPVYFRVDNSIPVPEGSYNFDNFGVFPSFHNINIQIFIFPIILAKLNKEKYIRWNNILIWIFLTVIIFLCFATFIGRIVQQIHYFVDGIASLIICIIVCFAFMKCQFMYKTEFVNLNKKILRSNKAILWIIALITVTYFGYMFHAVIEKIFGQ